MRRLQVTVETGDNLAEVMVGPLDSPQPHRKETVQPHSKLAVDVPEGMGLGVLEIRNEVPGGVDRHRDVIEPQDVGSLADVLGAG